MITAITAFRMPKPVTREEARNIFLSTAPKYLGVSGLIQKVYYVSLEENTLGGIYLWKSKAEAEAMYTESWKTFVREKYGTEATVTYLDCPVVVDNNLNQIISDE
ncbi:MAG: monooxygenase [Rhodocyclaceae bacterium]|nr:MAG: monooxygenase [Rhodocyclaceae bacterium]